MQRDSFPDFVSFLLPIVAAWALGLIGHLHEARAQAEQDDPSLRKAFLEKAPKSWQDYLIRTKTLQDRKLPPGFTSLRRKYPRMSFLTRLLPYLEQQTLWRATVAAYDYQPVPTVDPPHIGFSYPIATFVCPADGRPYSQHMTHKNRRVALTSYAGVLGTDYTQRDGVLFVDSAVTLVSIRDGTSNTLMVGERPPSADLWYGWWYAGFGQQGTGSADMLLGTRERSLGERYTSSCPPGPYHFRPGRESQQCDLFHFWSFHAGGAHFLFADGSVRFLAYGADDVLPALGTRSGGEVVNMP